MAISIGAAIAVAAGAAAGLLAEKKGALKTPAGNLGRAAGLDISGGAFTPKPPSLLTPNEEPKAMPNIDDKAIKKSRLNTLLDLQRRSGRYSTLLTNQAANNTFGG